MAEPGRPEFTETDYQNFLDAMAPFLKLGETIYHAIEDAGLTQHKGIIYNKYRLNDWFLEKVDILRSHPGKLINNILSKAMIAANERLAQGLPLTDEEWRNIRFMAEKYRPAQPYFVSRTETAVADPDKVGKILDTMESDYAAIGQKANEQVVAANPPIQDTKQAGANSDVPAQPTTT